MSKVVFNISVSADGFAADTHDQVDKVFQWYGSGSTAFTFPGTEMIFKISKNSAKWIKDNIKNIGAMLTGKHNFDLAQAWGGHPPLGVPHIVVTHNPDKKWQKEGSPFTFVTDGIKAAINEARKQAKGKDVCISSPNVLQQSLAEGLVDEIYLDVVPILLGKGVRLFGDNKQAFHQLEILDVVQGEGVTHIRYKVKK